MKIKYIKVLTIIVLFVILSGCDNDNKKQTLNADYSYSEQIVIEKDHTAKSSCCK